ncbi:MAG: hypothetical protein PHN80_12500 [Hespellia sp.]|nr:hypothetical protein [Hespellia sp.]
MQRKLKAYICSPLSAATRPEMIRNMLRAREHMRKIRERYGFSTYAPHAYLPELLNDHDPEERALALSFGLELLKLCDILIVCGDTISEGMTGEIRYAFERGTPVYCCNNEDTCKLMIMKEGSESSEKQIQKKDIPE